MRRPRCHGRHGSRKEATRLRAHALLGRFLPRLGPLAVRLSGLFRSGVVLTHHFDRRTR